MFTGIVTGIGTVRKVVNREGGLELTIQSPYGRLEPGESVAVDGACLTIEAATPDAFSVHVIRTTLDRTRFGEYATGQRVNLERALQAGDRLGGHLVQAHVDGVGKVELVTQREDARLLDLRVPEEVGRVTVLLGSITVDGVSLTVNAKPGSGCNPDLPHPVYFTAYDAGRASGGRSATSRGRCHWKICGGAASGRA